MRSVLKTRPSSGEAMSLWDHLDELRSRLFKVSIAFILGSAVSWFFYDQILAWMVAPLRRLPEADQIVSKGKLIFTSPPEALFVRLKVVAFAGLVLALPVILWQLWRFITPGLYKHEKRLAVPFVFTSLVLFGIGGVLASYLLPKTVAVLVALGGSEFVLVPRASEYLSFVLLLVVGFGATFEFPLVLIFLALAGVVTARKLRRGRKVAWVVALVVSAIVTPTADPVTQLALAVPLGLLYELTILVVHLLQRRRTAAE